MSDIKFDPIGKQTYSVDEKNRVRVPAEIFAKFGDAKLVVTPGVLGCMCLMPQQTYDEIVKPLAEADFFDFEMQDSYTMMNDLTITVDRDSQNRIVIPGEILKRFGVFKDIVFIAKSKFVEMWAAEEYASKRPAMKGAADVSEAMKKLGALMRERALR